MKILIIGFTKVKYMPYMNFYLDNIDKNKHEVHILYWNRDLLNEDLSKYTGCIFHEFKCYQEDDVSKFSKIRSFIKYKKFTKKFLLNEKFDFLFVLHSLPGVLISDILKKKYCNKYILDYRDSTYERFALFKKILGTMVKNACATFVSSDAFRRFLPEDCTDKIHTSHNFLLDSLYHREDKKLYGISSDKIRIAFWGFIRNEDLNKEIIRKLYNDERFELHYYGREQQVARNLKIFISELAAKNIFFHGEYIPEQRYEFIRKTDIIHNIYYDNNTLLAMGNKYYDGIIFRIPQICMQGAYMAEKVQDKEIGLSCNPYDDDFADKVYNYYISINEINFKQNCDVELEKILREYEQGVLLIESILQR